MIAGALLEQHRIGTAADFCSSIRRRQTFPPNRFCDLARRRYQASVLHQILKVEFAAALQMNDRLV